MLAPAQRPLGSGVSSLASHAGALALASWFASRDRAYGRAFVERAKCVVGTPRRECLDHLIVVNERHLRTVLEEFVRHSNEALPHQASHSRYREAITSVSKCPRVADESVDDRPGQSRMPLHPWFTHPGCFTFSSDTGPVVPIQALQTSVRLEPGAAGRRVRVQQSKHARHGNELSWVRRTGVDWRGRIAGESRCRSIPSSSSTTAM